MELFCDVGIPESERLYIIGNGFDIHHSIESKYSDFKKWLINDGNSRLVGLMDIFFSNEHEFWGDIEKALGEYDEDNITVFCEPENEDDFKYEHPGQWQAGVEDSISYIFEEAMNEFRAAFDKWVRNIAISGLETDLQLPQVAKYLTFNYTEVLEKAYGIPEQNILHIHGCRLAPNNEFIIGHGNDRDAKDPYKDDSLLLPYQNAYSSVIGIMNKWRKDPQSIIASHKDFFTLLNGIKGVCVKGISYSDIDMPYLKEVAVNVAEGCRWVLNYYNDEDMAKAKNAAIELGLNNYSLVRFD